MQGEDLKGDSALWSDFLQVCERVLGPELGALAVEQYDVYLEKQGSFGSKMAQMSVDTMKPHAWWSSYGQTTPQLRMLAMRVLSQPASASSSEQSWSQYDYVHSKTRNRLKVSVASKLVYVHCNLKLLSKLKNYNRYQDLLNLSSEKATEAQSKLANELLHESWDGYCSEEEFDSEASTSSIATIGPSTEELNTNSFVANGHEPSRHTGNMRGGRNTKTIEMKHYLIIKYYLINY